MAYFLVSLTKLLTEHYDVATVIKATSNPLGLISNKNVPELVQLAAASFSLGCLFSGVKWKCL